MSNRKAKKINKTELNLPDIRHYLSGKSNMESPISMINTSNIHQREGEPPLIIPKSLSIDDTLINDNLNNDDLNNDKNEIDDNKFMKFFHVTNLINPKHEKNEPIKNKKNDITEMNTEKQVEFCLLYKLNKDSNFFRYLNMSKHGRIMINQMDMCFQTLQNCVDMNPCFKEELNDLICKQENGLLT